jgi:hypothetical protein
MTHPALKPVPISALFSIAPNLRTASNRALSLYLPIRAEGFDAHEIELTLNHLAARYQDRLDQAERHVLDSELARMRTHLNIVRPAGFPAVAGFADEGAGLLTLIRLPETVEARLEVGPLLLAPIERLLAKYPPALVLVADKKEARSFAAVLGELVPLQHQTGNQVKHSRVGGTSALSNQRKADNITGANLQSVVRLADEEVQHGGFVKLFLGGPPEARSELERLLPPHLAAIVAGHVSASLDMTPGELLRDLRRQLQAVPARSAIHG